MAKRSLSEIEKYLHEQIPVTSFMGFRLVSLTPDGIRFRAPLGPNINHRDSAFGGSIATLGILAGWAYIHLELIEINLNCRLVIKKSALDFLEPILGDFEAYCKAPEPAEWEKFRKNLIQYRMARLGMTSEIYYQERLAGKHEGIYVASLLR